MSKKNNKENLELMKEKLSNTAKDKVDKASAVINKALNSNSFYSEKIKPLFDKIPLKISKKLLFTILGSLLFLCIILNTIGKAGHKGKLDADYYVYQTKTAVQEGNSSSTYGSRFYSDLVTAGVFSKHEGDKILELFTFKKFNSAKGNGYFSSMLGWEFNNYLPVKYKIKNKTELYLINEDGTVDESSYWKITGNSILLPDGKELIAMSESEFRRTTKIGTESLKQDYSKNIRTGKMESIYELTLKEIEQQKTENENQ